MTQETCIQQLQQLLFSVVEWLTMPLVEQVVSAVVKNDAVASHAWTRWEDNSVYKIVGFDQTDKHVVVTSPALAYMCLQHHQSRLACKDLSASSLVLIDISP